MSEGFVEFVTGEQSAAVSALRLEAYGGVSDMTVKAPSLVWSRADDQSFVLGAFCDGRLVATMRVELIATWHMLAVKLETDQFQHRVKLPAMILSRAATSREYSGRGLNALLRSYAFELARNWGIDDVLGTLMEGSPRIGSMQRMGYVLIENTEGWQSEDFHASRRTLVAHLDLAKHYDRALAVAREIAGEYLGEFPWHGDVPAARYVTVIK